MPAFYLYSPCNLNYNLHRNPLYWMFIFTTTVIVSASKIRISRHDSLANHYENWCLRAMLCSSLNRSLLKLNSLRKYFNLKQLELKSELYQIACTNVSFRVPRGEMNKSIRHEIKLINFHFDISFPYFTSSFFRALFNCVYLTQLEMKSQQSKREKCEKVLIWLKIREFWNTRSSGEINVSFC